MSEARLVFIELNGGRPFSAVFVEGVIVRRYSLAWSKKLGRLVGDYVGGGVYVERGDSSYWIDEMFLAELPGGVIDGAGVPASGTRLKRRPKCSTAVAELIDSGVGGFIWCNRCDDFLPTGGLLNVCDHAWWCDEHGWWCGPGVYPGDGCCDGDCEDNE